MIGNKRRIKDWTTPEDIADLVYVDFLQSITEEQAVAILDSYSNGTLVWTDRHIKGVGSHSFTITEDGIVWQS